MKNQRPDLNTLPRALPFICLIHERAMRHSPSPTIHLGIKTLDQQNLARCLLAEVEPAMIRVWTDGECFAHAIGIDQLYGDEVVIWYGRGVCDSELGRNSELAMLIQGGNFRNET